MLQLIFAQMLLALSYNFAYPFVGKCLPFIPLSLPLVFAIFGPSPYPLGLRSCLALAAQLAMFGLKPAE